MNNTTHIKILLLISIIFISANHQDENVTDCLYVNWNYLSNHDRMSFLEGYQAGIVSSLIEVITLSDNKFALESLDKYTIEKMFLYLNDRLKLPDSTLAFVQYKLNLYYNIKSNHNNPINIPYLDIVKQIKSK